MSKLLVLCLALAGCSAMGTFQNPADMALVAPGVWDMKCLGRDGDDGKEVYWETFSTWDDTKLNPPNLIRTDFYSKRYVCKNHGPERHGWWFEQSTGP